MKISEILKQKVARPDTLEEGQIWKYGNRRYLVLNVVVKIPDKDSFGGFKQEGIRDIRGIYQYGGRWVMNTNTECFTSKPDKPDEAWEYLGRVSSVTLA